jgi:hypothetical protein
VGCQVGFKQRNDLNSVLCGVWPVSDRKEWRQEDIRLKRCKRELMVAWSGVAVA